jgi:hypothetical protein
MTNYTVVATYASVRRGSGPFAAPERLSVEGVSRLTGSRVAFQPVTGEATVAFAYVAPDGRGAIQSSTSPVP